MKKITCLIWMQLVVVLSYGQNGTIIRQLKDFYETLPESIILHNDRDFYFSGETVWYKVYLTNVATVTSDLSVVGYIEITDEAGNVLVRNKQKFDNGLAFGNITLPENLPGAVYLLKAYTLPMMNVKDLLAFEKPLAVFNKHTLGQTLGAKIFPGNISACSDKLVAKREGNNLKIDIDANTEGTLIVHSRGKILLNRNVGDLRFPYVVNNITRDELTVAVFNNDQKLSCEVYVSRSAESGFSIDVDYDALIKPDARGTVGITLRDSLGDLAGGSFSVSIRRKFAFAPMDQRFFEGTITFNQLQKLGDLKALSMKEKYLYPKHSGSLAPLKFNEQVNVLQSSDATSKYSISSDEIERQKLISRVDSLYGPREKQYDYVDTYLPFDNTYIPDEFQALPTLEEFFVEVVKQGKIKRKRGKTTLILKNTENKSNVFNYKDNPLILVDGYIVSDINAVLNFDPVLIRKINLTWRTGTLSEAAIASLADNGILAIYSKSGAMPIGSSTGPGVYDGFHIPFDFKAINDQPTSDNETPVFSDLLYWNPGVEVRGKQKLSFVTSTDLGEYVIDIAGVTYTGEYIRKQVTFEVRFKK